MKKLINDLIHNCHTEAVYNGWWEILKKDLDTRIVTAIDLVAGELAEAVEAMRKEQFSKTEDLDRFMDLRVEAESIALQFFKDKIKDTFEDEIADTVIRAADLLGHFQAEMIENPKRKKKTKSVMSTIRDLRILALETAREVEIFGKKRHYKAILALEDIILWCFEMVPRDKLEKHIEAKLVFNSSRGKRHGKTF